MTAILHAVRALLALLLVQAALADLPCEDVVCVEVEETGRLVTFYAVSRTSGVSITFSVSVVNMEPAAPPILTRPLEQGRTRLMALKPVPGKRYQWAHAFIWEWGVVGATHDDRVSYRLPYEPQQTFRLFQGPGGELSHKGKAAYDFPMARGTPVHAARAGMVVKVVDEFDEGGFDVEFADKANEVLILHDDGTLATYVHLQRGGMRVKAGDRVEAGTVIGSSGNSGRSTGPHLHFEVFRVMADSKRESLPVRFTTADGDHVELEEGKPYRAARR